MRSFTSMSVLTELTIKMLGMTGKDDSATDVANAQLNADANAGYYKKCKIARADILPVIHARDAARNYHRQMTSPWGKKDLRLLPTSRLLEYNSAMSDYKATFENAVADIEANWDAIVDKQKNRLNKKGGTLFNPTDYPPKYEVADWFVFKTSQLPVPEVKHFALDLEAHVIDKLKRDLEKDNSEKIAQCQADMFTRLIMPVSKMADICSNDKKVFDSMVNNLEDTIDILTDLNVTGNVEFMNMITEIKDSLTGFTPGQIRKNKRLKQRLGAKANEMAAKIEIIMGEIKC
jgi:hypothetical protein